MALAKGMEVTSVSSSGQPWRTPKGHTPAWVKRVEWRKADVLADKRGELQEVLASSPPYGAVVHTLGTLLEGGEYKQSVRDSNPLALVKNLFPGSRNPLKRDSRWSYETMNKQSALNVLSDTLSTRKPKPEDKFAFVFASAEDIFRPLIPEGYIASKRAAEREIEATISRENAPVRSVFARPSFMYHPHWRPLSTPPAALLDLFVNLERGAPKGIPTPASILRSLASPGRDPADLPSALASVANALTIPPMHVDHVAEAIVRAIQDESVKGPLDVVHMRELIGWSLKGADPAHAL
ncbi:uncharacterized protein SCHCODRAFT_02604900 [Schizophyllum commune H4-8]|uniref:uncharacterized protein n=1 Tax=Schizophyllum commune (strain H4-8 / FGSC 9210) TaxID=578458 RepID=UPI00216007CA|nr:uncharacterized protein SCHCODRAFT_02604900 [Schizophyllum commune H4-8]KAI5899353.1 hypothetical protein SCHCODRAFT_02604900 [Schizophyllum commune H4-8]